MLIWRNFTACRPYVFNEAFKRNGERFPEDFAFQLTADRRSLKSQSATSRAEVPQQKSSRARFAELVTVCDQFQKHRGAAYVLGPSLSTAP